MAYIGPLDNGGGLDSGVTRPGVGAIEELASDIPETRDPAGLPRKAGLWSEDDNWLIRVWGWRSGGMSTLNTLQHRGCVVAREVTPKGFKVRQMIWSFCIAVTSRFANAGCR